MIRVVKIFLYRGFTPINNKIFKLDTTLNFDCYIQRFNGFAILVKSGTLLDAKILSKLAQKDLQVYVATNDYHAYKHYYHTHEDKKPQGITHALNLEEEIAHSLSISKALAQQQEVYEKLKLIYSTGTNLLNAWLLKKNEKLLPLEALETLAENLVEIMVKNKITLSTFNGFLDNTYSLPTHLVHVAFFSSLIASNCNLDLTDQKQLTLAAMLHDVGKTMLDDEVLEKPDTLTHAEYKIIQSHVDKSITLIKKAHVSNRVIINAIKQHHEKLDGSGYPSGIKEDRIGIFGRIIGICDIFDALITIKPYRGAYSTYNALYLINQDYQTKLDMKYVNILIQNMR
ncbi:MAG: HD domain-containing protein [Sulfurospirillaceae bacterium]|nr:HD domain-containing protein [Sulfurospirillaceae bacterium]MDD2826148.1 HD domain-containing protein [Sulfurospirillaceae bacterium]